MLRTSLLALVLCVVTLPTLLYANDNLKAFDAVIAAKEQVQPGLEHYTVMIETSRIKEMMERLTSGIPSDVAPPPAPVIIKFWQRNGEGVIFAEQVTQAPYVEKMMEQISRNLAIELNEMLLPADKAALRHKLTKHAEVKSSEVALADTLIKNIEITFPAPTDLDEAFYVSGMRLPQKQITALSFDIDTKKKCVTEFGITTAGDLQLTVEIRYLAVTGGHIPERFKITSPDGSVDDLFEVTFLEAEGFQMPASMLRTIRRPELQDKLEVSFKNYLINQPVSDAIKARLKAQ